MGMFDKGQNKKMDSAKTLDVYDRIGSADTYGDKSEFPLPGLYPILYLDALRVFTSRKGDEIAIADFDILSSLVPERPSGTTMCYMWNFRFDATPSDFRKFLAALNDVAIEEVDAGGARHACSDANPCHGRLIRMTAELKKRDGKKDLTLAKWEVVEAKTQEQAEELHDKAGFGSVPF